MIVSNVLELVGNTPMVRINSLNMNKDVALYAKLEKVNPGGSIKDRICRYMIEKAELDGTLKNGMTVIEPTSGNTGIGLAWVCGVKGYKCILVMPDTVTKERRKILMVHGAHVILSPGEDGMNGAQDVAKEIVAKDPEKYFMPNQFKNDYNYTAHYETTAKEIWDDTKGTITHFVAGMGTTGTLMGVSRYLKEKNPAISVTAVEPYPDDPIPGLKNLDISYVPEIYDSSYINEKVHISLPISEDMARLLAMREGMFCGPSSGAIMKAALQKAHSISEGVIVAVLPDGGEKYLSTELCDMARCLECIAEYGISCSLADEYLNNVPKKLGSRG